jgi:hypothetical protein
VRATPPPAQRFAKRPQYFCTERRVNEVHGFSTGIGREFSLRSVTGRHEIPLPHFRRLKLRPFLKEKLVGAVGIEPTTSPV